MRRVWIAVLISTIALAVLVVSVASQQDADVEAVAEIQIDVPAITGTHVITVPLQVSIPMTGDQEILVTIDVAVNLRVTDVLTIPALVASPVVTVLPSPTPTSTPTNTPAPTSATVNANANVRAGPGTNFTRVGTLEEGQEIEIVGVNEAGDWYQLAPGQWIAAFLVDNAPSELPVVEVEPTATPAPTATPTPRPTATATPEPEPESALTLTEYTDLVADETSDIGEALGVISEQVTSPDAGTDAWKLRMASQMVAVQLAHGNLLAAVPPALFADVHLAIVDATADCDAAMEELATGIDDLDVDAISRANALMVSCGEKATEASRQMQALLP